MAGLALFILPLTVQAASDDTYRQLNLFGDVFERVRAAAGAEGPAFAFEQIRLRVNTLRAHRLVYRAQALGWRPEVVRAMVDALFVAYFQDARDIGDIGTLADIAAAAGGRRDDVLTYLEGEDDVAAVRKMANQLTRQGVSGVPFFVFNRRLAVSGAQSEAALGAALIQSLGESG